MKRLLLVAFSTLALAGCTTNEAQKAAEDFIEETKVVETIDENSKISGDLKKELVEHRSALLDDVLEALGIKEDLSLTDAEGYKTLTSKLAKLQEKMKYTVIEVNEDKKGSAEIVADIEYYDLSESFEEILSDTIDRGVVKAYEEGHVEGKDFLENFISELIEHIDKIDLDDLELNTVEGAKSTIHKEKDVWKINDIDEKTLNAISLGMQNAVDKGIKNKLDEVKENIEFFKIENNFKNTIKILEEEFNGESKVNIDNFMEGESKDNLTKRISQVVGTTVVLADKVGKEEGVYYVTREDDNISVTLNLKGQEYSYINEKEE